MENQLENSKCRHPHRQWGRLKWVCPLNANWLLGERRLSAGTAKAHPPSAHCLPQSALREPSGSSETPRGRQDPERGLGQRALWSYWTISKFSHFVSCQLRKTFVKIHVFLSETCTYNCVSLKEKREKICHNFFLVFIFWEINGQIKITVKKFTDFKNTY